MPHLTSIDVSGNKLSQVRAKGGRAEGGEPRGRRRSDALPWASCTPPMAQLPYLSLMNLSSNRRSSPAPHSHCPSYLPRPSHRLSFALYLRSLPPPRNPTLSLVQVLDLRPGAQGGPTNLRVADWSRNALLSLRDLSAFSRLTELRLGGNRLERLGRDLAGLGLLKVRAGMDVY